MQRRTHPRRSPTRDVRGRWQWLAPLPFLAQAVCCPAFAQDFDEDSETTADENGGDDDEPSGNDVPPPPTAPARDAEEEGPVDPATTERAMPRGRAVDRAGNPLVAAHFDSTREGLRIFLGPARAQPDAYGTTMGRPRLDTGELRELCAAPCARWIYPGEYSFGAAPATEPDEREKQPLRARDPLTLHTPVLVTTDYQSYGWLRAVGWATMGAGLIGGSALVLVAFDRCAGDGLCLQDSPYAWLGAGTFFLGVTGGLLLTLKGDEVSFSVTPNPRLPEPR